MIPMYWMKLAGIQSRSTKRDDSLQIAEVTVPLTATAEYNKFVSGLRMLKPPQS
jgi:hypothetical protein